MEMLTIITVGVTLFVHALIALYDFAYFRIPNGLVILLFIISLFWGVTSLSFDQMIYHFAVFLGMLILGFSLFAFGWIGGGDAKYLAVSSIWIGLSDLASYILWIAIVGGVLSLFFILFKQTIPLLSDSVWARMVNIEKKIKPLSWVWMMSAPGAKGQRAIAQKSVPYGIAIAVGSWIILLGRLSS